MILRRMSTVTLVGVIIATLLFANTASANHGFGSTLTVRDNNTQDYEMVGDLHRWLRQIGHDGR